MSSSHKVYTCTVWVLVAGSVSAFARVANGGTCGFANAWCRTAGRSLRPHTLSVATYAGRISLQVLRVYMYKYARQLVVSQSPRYVLCVGAALLSRAVFYSILFRLIPRLGPTFLHRSGALVILP